jgi:adenylate cyclase
MWEHPLVSHASLDAARDAMTHVASDKDLVDQLNRELAELRSRQEAVAGILRVLSRSGMRLQPILDQIIAAATRLCRADSGGFLYFADGDLYRVRAYFDVPADLVEYERLHPDRPGLSTCIGRVAMTKRPVHIPDVLDDPDYDFPAIDRGRYRTLLGLPVFVEDELVGVIAVARSEVCPFEPAEIKLMVTFADQSAIAIANAELFETVARQKAEIARFVSPEVAALVSSDEGKQLLAGHRAFITVVYFDLRGFTAFAETAEPEELIDVVREYHAVAGELVRAHGGTLEHFAGDGLMVFFNDPVPLPEHELQAARLACAMRERVGELAEGWRKRGYELGLGGGIAVGHATLGRIGFEGRFDYGALGIVTSLAARLSDEAAAGQILLSQRAYAALSRGRSRPRQSRSCR